MKILVISDAQGIDGAQGSLRYASRYWSNELGWEIDVFQPRGLSDQQAIISQAGMNPISEILPNTRYNVVLVNSFLNIDYLAKVTNVPIVFWVHEADIVLRTSSMPVRVMNQLFSIPHKIIFQTVYQPNVVFKSFVHQLPPERFSIIPCGIESFEIPPIQKADDNIFKVCSLGNVNSNKRPIDLINAVHALSSTFPISAKFIGSLGDSASLGPEFQDFLKASPENISWTGALPRIQAIEAMASSDVYCQTSADESFAIAPLEAAALGIPVILTNLPVYQFVGWKHGENCLMYPVGDVGALAKCIQELRHNVAMRASLGSRGKALADLYSGNLFLQRITQLMKAWEPAKS